MDKNELIKRFKFLYKKHITPLFREYEKSRLLKLALNIFKSFLLFALLILIFILFCFVPSNLQFIKTVLFFCFIFSFFAFILFFAFYNMDWDDINKKKYYSLISFLCFNIKHAYIPDLGLGASRLYEFTKIEPTLQDIKLQTSLKYVMSKKNLSSNEKIVQYANILKSMPEPWRSALFHVFYFNSDNLNYTIIPSGYGDMQGLLFVAKLKNNFEGVAYMSDFKNNFEHIPSYNISHIEQTINSSYTVISNDTQAQRYLNDETFLNLLYGAKKICKSKNIYCYLKNDSLSILLSGGGNELELFSVFHSFKNPKHFIKFYKKLSILHHLAEYLYNK